MTGAKSAYLRSLLTDVHQMGRRQPVVRCAACYAGLIWSCALSSPALRLPPPMNGDDILVRQIQEDTALPSCYLCEAIIDLL